MNNFTFFWKNRSPFSNWYPSIFTYGGQTFSCGEQFMMWAKAFTFHDLETVDKIMKTSSHKEHQELGRQVKEYDDEIWADMRYQVMVLGLYAKFSQNERLKELLLATGDTIIAEASPSDKIWGIGLVADDPLAQDMKNWKGQNLLGKVLMEVREKLKL